MARILVVDDDPDLVELVVARLLQADYRAVGLHSAEEALAFVAAKGAPDIAVLDVTMPGMDGLELVERLREATLRPDLPVIFLSGRLRDEDIESGRALGALYLTKPFVANTLNAAVARILADAERNGTVIADRW